MSFSPSVPTLISSSNVFVVGNTASGNALSVQQRGAGNVASFSNASGSIGLFVSSTSNVGVGTASPFYQLSVATGLGATATPTVHILDTVGSKTLSVIPNAGSGVYNAMVATGDTLMVAGVGSTVNTGVLTLAPWSGSSVGARIGGSSNIFGIYSNATTFYSNATSPATVMTVTNGRVGIGMTNPGYPLHVIGDVYSSSNINGTSGNTTWRLQPQYNSSAPFNDYFRITNGWNPIAGTGEANYAGCGLNLNSYQSGSQIEFYTSSTNNAVPTERMRIDSSGRVGIGTTSPQNTLDINGSQMIRNPTIYNTGASGWYIIGLWVADAGTGNSSGQRLRLELIGGNGFNNALDSQRDTGGVTTIYATILNNSSTGRANCGGTFKHDGSGVCCSQVKFVQNSTNRNQYYVYVNMTDFTQHGLRIDTTQGAYFTPSFTSTTDPGANSATVQSAAFIGIFGYGSSAAVGIGVTNPKVPLQIGSSTSDYNNSTTSAQVNIIGPSCTPSISTGQSLVSTLYVSTEAPQANNKGASIGLGALQGFSSTNAMQARISGVPNNSAGISGDLVFEVLYNNTGLLNEKMRISGSNGYVGIGVANPSYPLQVTATSTIASGTYKYFNSGSTGLQSSSSAYASIYAGSSIVAADAIVASDQRIKKLEDPPESFLDIVDKLKVHQYSYIDKVTKHTDKQFGFFAQEVREILPGAVKFTDGIVPTVYREAETFTSNSVTLTNHGIKVGANLQMFSYMADDNVIEVNATVTVVIDENIFEVSTTSPLGGTKLFILGEKVSDFHNLNYDYVSSVGFGGLKELHALVKTQQKTIEALELRLAALEARA